MLPESIEKEKKVGRLQRRRIFGMPGRAARKCLRHDSGVYPHGDNAKQFAKWWSLV
jgi:hypothetical protein